MTTHFMSSFPLLIEDSSRDEGISIPRREPNRFDDDHSALAKSLPMRVPALSKYRSQDVDIEDDKVDTQSSLSFYRLVSVF